jgi:hypothetical protein
MIAIVPQALATVWKANEGTSPSIATGSLWRRASGPLSGPTGKRKIVEETGRGISPSRSSSNEKISANWNEEGSTPKGSRGRSTAESEAGSDLQEPPFLCQAIGGPSEKAELTVNLLFRRSTRVWRHCQRPTSIETLRILVLGRDDQRRGEFPQSLREIN